MARLRKDVANVWLMGASYSRLWTCCIYCGSDANFVADYGSPDEDSQTYRCEGCRREWVMRYGSLLTDDASRPFATYGRLWDNRGLE